MNKKLIFIEGTSGSGKSTLARGLVNIIYDSHHITYPAKEDKQKLKELRYKVCRNYEEERNFYIEAFKNIEANFKNIESNYIIFDRSWITGVVDTWDGESSVRIQESFFSELARPAYVIHVQTPIRTCLERITERQKNEDIPISKFENYEYLTHQAKKYTKALCQMQSNIIKINGELPTSQSIASILRHIKN